MAWIEQRKNGACWVACWKVCGRKVRRSTGIRIKEPGRPASKQKMLAEQVALAMERAARGELPADKACDAVRKVAEMHGTGGAVPSVKSYMTSFPHARGATNERLRQVVFRRFCEFLGDAANQRIDSIKPVLCQSFIRKTLERVSIRTAERYKYYISQMFTRAIDVDELMYRNPMRHVNVAEEARVVNPEIEDDYIRRRPFSLDEIKFMITQFPAPWRDMVAVSWYTAGLRLSDVCLLRWEYIDWERECVHIVEKKTGRRRVLPLIPELKATLRAILRNAAKEAGYVFPDMARFYNNGLGTYISRKFKKLLLTHGMAQKRTIARKGDRRDLSVKSFHSIRHSVVSYLRSGVLFSADIIRDTVGHLSEQVEQGYFTGTLEARSQVCRSLAEGLENLGEAPSRPPEPPHYGMSA